MAVMGGDDDEFGDQGGDVKGGGKNVDTIEGGVNLPPWLEGGKGGAKGGRGGGKGGSKGGGSKGGGGGKGGGKGVDTIEGGVNLPPWLEGAKGGAKGGRGGGKGGSKGGGSKGGGGGKGGGKGVDTIEGGVNLPPWLEGGKGGGKSDVADSIFLQEVCTVDVAASREIECGICLEKTMVVGRRFGLLTSCTHAFCLECIRQWRHEDAQDGKRMCPLCRTQSYFIIPSAVHVIDEARKAAVLEAYCANMREIPCKKFDQGRGVCPYGSSCFYMHRYADGELERASAALPRFKADAGGGTSAVVSESSSLLDWMKPMPARRR